MDMAELIELRQVSFALATVGLMCILGEPPDRETVEAAVEAVGEIGPDRIHAFLATSLAALDDFMSTETPG